MAQDPGAGEPGQCSSQETNPSMSGLQFTDIDWEPGELLSHQGKHWLGNTLLSPLEGSEQQEGVKSPRRLGWCPGSRPPLGAAPSGNPAAALNGPARWVVISLDLRGQD